MGLFFFFTMAEVSVVIWRVHRSHLGILVQWVWVGLTLDIYDVMLLVCEGDADAARSGITL